MAKAIRLKNNDYINSDSIVHYRKTLSNILENRYHKIGKNLNSNGWYRVAKINDKQLNLMLLISSTYNYHPPSSVLVSILTIYQNAKISQINSIKFPDVFSSIDKIRVQYDNTSRTHYIDIYYTPTNMNEVTIQCENRNDLDYIKILNPSLVSFEYTTLDEITIVY